MADTKLSSLSALTQSSLASTDEFYVAHSGGSYSISRSELDKQWVQTALADVAHGYASLDSSGAINAKVIIRHDTASALASVVLDAGQMGWTTDTHQLYVGDGTTAISSLPTVTGPALLTSPPSGTQTIQTPASSGTTGVQIAGGTGGGAGRLTVCGGATGHGRIAVQGSQSGAQANAHILDGFGGVQFDLFAPAGPSGTHGIQSDGQGNLSVSNFLSAGIINVLGITVDSAVLTITNNVNVFTGSSTVTWTLPSVSYYVGTPIVIKNAGSATLTVNADAGSDIVITTRAAAASSTSVTSGNALRLVSDGTYWNVI